MDLRSSRFWIGLATGLLVVASLAAILAACVGARFHLPVGDKPDQMVVINTVVAIAACLLVALAGVVALVAYLIATGTPSLRIEIQFPFSDLNRPVFMADEQPGPYGELPVIKWYKQSNAAVTLVNDSKYSARNPGVRIEFVNIGDLRGQLPGWSVIASANQIGTTALQWDGGVDNLIHGNWARTLPALQLGQGALYGDEQDAALKVTLVADGIKPQITLIPIRVLSDEEYSEYSAKRAEEIGA